MALRMAGLYQQAPINDCYGAHCATTVPGRPETVAVQVSRPQSCRPPTTGPDPLLPVGFE